jgi:hypothetical protein
MKVIKINWGTKIVILYIGFVGMTLTMVLQTMGYKVDLVTPDYYEQELKFQDKIDANKNVESLHLVFHTEARNKSVMFSFPAEWKGKNVVGRVQFYRASNSDLDLSFPVNLHVSGIQMFASEKFKRGIYKMLCDFTFEEKKFCYEETLFMN